MQPQSENTVDNKRIAKNTALLYVRMLFSMGVGLFTSRVILASLGVVDYGINNVVGGVVAMFGFLNAAMTTSTQRYLTFELGRGETGRLRLAFMTSLYIHIIIAVTVVLLAETVGLWFLKNKIVIPEGREIAAMYCYQFAILSTVVSILSYPFNAAIVSHEKMSAFAYISILDVILKLAVAYTLYMISFDKLIAYSTLMLSVQILMTSIYVIYCKRHFDETHFRRLWDIRLLKEMGSFAGWNMWGNIAYILFTQGINILLNMFFGPVVNAARGVAVQVQGAIMQFAGSFQTALNPQITKTYSQNDLENMHRLIFRSSKFTFFLLLCLSLPVILEADVILNVWLKEVPEYSAIFLRLMLCIAIIDSVANPLMVSAAATGKVKVYQSVVGGILLAIVPISYIVLKLGGNPYSVFIVHLCVCIIAFIVRLYIVKPLIKITIPDYVVNVITKCAAVAIPAIGISILFKALLPQSVLYAVLVCCLSAATVAVFAYYIGLTRHEREVIGGKVTEVINLFRK